MCTCVLTDRGIDTFWCQQHGHEAWNGDEISDEGKQWNLDHPGGVISAEEEESMARYADEACREEGHR